MADLLYAVLLIGVFVVLALTLRGLEKLCTARAPEPALGLLPLDLAVRAAAGGAH